MSFSPPLKSNLDDEQKKKRSTPNLEIRKKPQQHVKTKGELDLKDLPPIGDLKISVEKDALRCMGLVLSIVDCLGTFQSY